MNGTLEKVAEAIGTIQIGVDEENGAIFLGPHLSRTIVRAVLMALRDEEPSVEPDIFEVGQVVGMMPVWQAVIDAILAQEPGS